MPKEARDEMRVIFRVAVLEYAKNNCVTQTCQGLKVPRSSFYHWKKKYDQEGRSGLYREKARLHKTALDKLWIKDHSRD